VSTTAQNLVTAEALVKTYDTRRGLIARLVKRRDHLVHALSGVSFGIARGETLGLIGESGCGTTSRRCCSPRAE
jgi:ABC-type oligopeptide transport system ATPase subunit